MTSPERKLRELIATRPDHPTNEDLRSWWRTSGELLDELLNPATPLTPLDELAHALVVDLHGMSHEIPRAAGDSRLDRLLTKTHALAIIISDTRDRLLWLERRAATRREPGHG